MEREASGQGSGPLDRIRVRAMVRVRGIEIGVRVRPGEGVRDGGRVRGSGRGMVRLEIGLRVRIPVIQFQLF